MIRALECFAACALFIPMLGFVLLMARTPESTDWSPTLPSRLALKAVDRFEESRNAVDPECASPGLPARISAKDAAELLRHPAEARLEMELAAASGCIRRLGGERWSKSP